MSASSHKQREVSRARGVGMKVDTDAATDRSIYMSVLRLTGTVFASTDTVSLPDVMLPKIYR